MKAENTNFISAAISTFKEAQESARRERKARHLEYKSRLVENFNYSPREFYGLLLEALEAREVPGLKSELASLWESVAGSSKRLYLTVARERFVYYICAAPFGSGFFFSWRFVDERQPGTWLHFLAFTSILLFLSVLIWYFSYFDIHRFLIALGLDALAQAQVLPFVPIALFLLLFTAIWSIMRCAALPRYERLASVLERIPIVGRIFERFFRPDTYYREDSKQMYQKVFDAVINETIDAVTTPRGIRQNEANRSPTVDRLFDK